HSYILLLFLLFSILQPPTTSTLFPYTTLFRSWHGRSRPGNLCSGYGRRRRRCCRDRSPVKASHRFASTSSHRRQIPARLRSGERSEEHTSELQSRSDIVCRLLLEKKK